MQKVLIAVVKGVALLVLSILKGIWFASDVILDMYKDHRDRKATKQHQANERELTKLLLERERQRLKEERAGK
ncbi:hypothetical protein [Sinorhizobium psoraleae]|uniref:Uncharacterized protein n=1 Tax=Sinorhizobium psoraleae TaxID=520838 RepID=A0ABT4KB74_9HYPH|nr:hypothetical protein [Sinorhizobium psoraleae]MCZ4089098.1 hypothetical protein [Sinorhizobium psoraleae]